MATDLQLPGQDWIRAMSYTTEIPVRWGDTDAGGLIYYPRFFHFVVVGVNEYFTPAVEDGHLMEHLRKEGYLLPAVETSTSFKSPLRAGDTARIEMDLTAGNTSLMVEFVITENGDEERIAAGEVTFVLVDRDFEPTSLPVAVHECIHARSDTSTS